MKISETKEITKKDWIEEVESLIKMDPRSGLKDITYVDNGTRGESAEINYRGVGKASVDITANSFGATLMAITKEIYY